MGEAKQVMLLGRKPMLKHVVDAFLSSSLTTTTLVLNPTVKWRPRPGKRLRAVVNRHPEDGLSSSLRLGLASIPRRIEAAVIGLGDKPLLSSSTIDSLVDEFRATGSDIIVPTYRGKSGNPILFGRSTFDELSRLKGDVGGKALIKRDPNRATVVPVDDAGVLLDVDTPSDFRRVARLFSGRRP